MFYIARIGDPCGVHYLFSGVRYRLGTPVSPHERLRTGYLFLATTVCYVFCCPDLSVITTCLRRKGMPFPGGLTVF
jgi:hypothetical protein